MATALLLASPAVAQTSPVGRWITEGDKAIVEIMPCGQALCGAVRKVLKTEPGAAAFDIHNADVRLRKRTVVGLNILTGFRRDGARWKGSIYDPRTGKTYKSFVEVKPAGTLALSGCVWMLCQTQTWRPAAR